MTSPDDDDTKPKRGKELTDKILRDHREFCFQIGRGVAFWQDVEIAHYGIFLTMAGLPENEISSVIYFSAESFDARHRMLSRMAAYFLVGPEHKEYRVEWQYLEKAIKDGNDNRNKFVHYATQYNDIDGIIQDDGTWLVMLGELRLQPIPENFVSRLLGRTSDKQEHNLSSKDVERFIEDFRALEKRMDQFIRTLRGLKPRAPLI